MNNWIMNAYSEVYSTAMMNDLKPHAFIATASKTTETRFKKLARILTRA